MPEFKIVSKDGGLHADVLIDGKPAPPITGFHVSLEAGGIPQIFIEEKHSPYHRVTQEYTLSEFKFEGKTKDPKEN